MKGCGLEKEEERIWARNEREESEDVMEGKLTAPQALQVFVDPEMAAPHLGQEECVILVELSEKNSVTGT